MGDEYTVISSGVANLSGARQLAEVAQQALSRATDDGWQLHSFHLSVGRNGSTEDFVAVLRRPLEKTEKRAIRGFGPLPQE